MGKGDKKTKRGKIIMGSSGKLRLKKNKKTPFIKPENVETVVKQIKNSTLPKTEKKTDTVEKVKKPIKTVKTTETKKQKKEE